MAFAGAMFSPSKSGGFQAARYNVEHPATTEQATDLYGQAQGGIGQQQAFLNALSAQGGIGNQSNVFGQQQALANQLQQQSLGQGPNPAQAQLANATGQNIAQQAALMGSQRGAGGNVGMMARQAGNIGANVQQQAAGQGAVLQAQQQLAAQQALQQQQAQMAGLSTQQVGQQAGALSGLNQAVQGEQGNILGAINAANQNEVSMQSNINNANAGIAGINAQGQQKLMGGILGGLGGATGLFAHGGMVSGYAQGGMAGPQSTVGRFFAAAPMNMMGGGPIPGQAKTDGDSQKNDTVPAMLSPGEIVVPRTAAKSPDKAKAFVSAVLAGQRRK